MKTKLNESEIFDLIKGSIVAQGIGEDEPDFSSQFLRDTFPEGVPLGLALKALKEGNLGRESSENRSLLYLAMVPTPGIEVEILARLNAYRSVKEQTNRSYSERFTLATALMYLNHAEGDLEFDTLRTIMSQFPKYERAVPDSYFPTIEAEVAQWRSDRAAGKRWEPAE